MMTKSTGTALLSASLFLSSVFAPSVQAAEAVAPRVASGFQMSAVIDRARGSIVLAGNYDKAIEVLSAKERKRFESSTNLCVAYTMTGELAKADTACSTALELSERSAVQRDIAVALSNRGVVKAVSGDLNGAQQDFSRALKVSSKFRQASENLELLRGVDLSGA